MSEKNKQKVVLELLTSTALSNLIEHFLVTLFVLIICKHDLKHGFPLELQRLKHLHWFKIMYTQPESIFI